MKFWDSSATVPLVLAEPATARVRRWLGEDGEIVVWWGTEVECLSAICRGEREGRLLADDVTEALRSLKDLRLVWQEVDPSGQVREQARRLLRLHQLRAADALQLAAAIVVANQKPAELEFVCLDERLAAAARREGFPVLA